MGELMEQFSPRTAEFVATTAGGKKEIADIENESVSFVVKGNRATGMLAKILCDLWFIKTPASIFGGDLIANGAVFIFMVAGQGYFTKDRLKKVG